MARNFNKPGRNAPRPKQDVDNTSIENASPQQLEKWLTQPPSPELLRKWLGTPFPLKRALELDRKDLFKKWHEEGCSLLGNLQPDKPLVLGVGDRTKTFLEWTADLAPTYFYGLVTTLARESKRSILADLDWKKIPLDKLPQQDLMKLASSSALGLIPNIDTVTLMKAVGGKMVQGYDLETIIHAAPYMRSYHYAIDPQYDRRMSQAINNLPEGVLLDAEVGLFATRGALLTAARINEQIMFNEGDRVELRVIRKYPSKMWSRTIEAWNACASNQPEEEIIDAIDQVFDHIDWKRKDREGNFCLHTLSLNRWPDNAVEHLVKKILTAHPSLAEARNGEGKLPEQSEKNCQMANIHIGSFRKKNKLTQRLKHNVRQTQAIREALSQKEEEPTAPKRRPMM